MSNKNKNRGTILYSTDPDFVYEDELEEEVETLPKENRN